MSGRKIVCVFLFFAIAALAGFELGLKVKTESGRRDDSIRYVTGAESEQPPAAGSEEPSMDYKAVIEAGDVEH